MAAPDVHAVLELDSAPWGRLRFGAPVEVIEARRLAEVRPAIRLVEAAARAGRWAVGYLAYEAAPAFDEALVVRAGEGPLVWFGIHERPLERDLAPDRDFDLARGLDPFQAALLDLHPEVDRAAHQASVERLREAIAAGTAYQVNLTYRLRGRLVGDPLALYRRLRAAQGGGETAFLRAGDRAIVSASPELFLLKTGDRVLTRPMKGTARRGRFAEEDEAAARALAGSEKDRAENVMIADLTRNDLGRVAETGSVAVTSRFDVVRLRTVWQLTSTVEARLAPGAGLRRCSAPPSPAAPSPAPQGHGHRLIAAEERAPRGPTAARWGRWPGRRRLLQRGHPHRGGRARRRGRYGTGGGITWGSDAEAEWDEAQAKTAVLAAAPGRPHCSRPCGSRGRPGPRSTATWRAWRRRPATTPCRSTWPPPACAGGGAGRPGSAPAAARAGRGRSPWSGPRGSRRSKARPPGLAARFISSRDPALSHVIHGPRPLPRPGAGRPDCFDVILLNEAGGPTRRPPSAPWWWSRRPAGDACSRRACCPGSSAPTSWRASRWLERPLTRAEVERTTRLGW
ncbi:MAG: chorismate-binding protein [Anaeromyxobacter sp.]|nr:chorismate-binding protein [Anaeromyxobacter sp.]